MKHTEDTLSSIKTIEQAADHYENNMGRDADAVKLLREYALLRARLSAPDAQPVQKPVALQHLAVSEGGKLRWMSGRKAVDCELYAMPEGGQAPKLYTHPAITQPAALPAPFAEICDYERGTDDYGRTLQYALVYALPDTEKILPVGTKLFLQPVPPADVPETDCGNITQPAALPAYDVDAAMVWIRGATTQVIWGATTVAIEAALLAAAGSKTS